jgi:hypothetical protein
MKRVKAVDRAANFKFSRKPHTPAGAPCLHRRSRRTRTGLILPRPCLRLRMKPAAKAGLMLSPEAATLYMRPVLRGLKRRAKPLPMFLVREVHAPLFTKSRIRGRYKQRGSRKPGFARDDKEVVAQSSRSPVGEFRHQVLHDPDHSEGDNWRSKT